MTPSIAILGRGRVGTGLARWLHTSAAAPNLVVNLYPGRTRATPREDVIVLCVPDPAIETVARGLAPKGRQSVVHCSGSLDVRALGPHASTAVMHPLVSFADPDHPPLPTGTRFVIDGEAVAVERARFIAEAAGAQAIIAPIHGPTYHAVAALSANGAAALAAVAVHVYEALGLSREQAQQAIGGLLRTVGQNVAQVGVPQALSGPVIRGDDSAVRRHRAALEQIDPEARAAYDAVAPAILRCASRAGLPEDRADAIRDAITGPPDAVS